MKIQPLSLNLRGVIVKKEVKTETQRGWRKLWHGKTVKRHLILVWFAYSKRVMWLSLSESLYNGVKEKQAVGVQCNISATKFYATTSTAPDSANDIFRSVIQEEPKSTMRVTHDEPKPEPAKTE